MLSATKTNYDKNNQGCLINYTVDALEFQATISCDLSES